MSNRNLFYQYLAQTSSFPLALEIERADGLYMTDPEGKTYMDLISGISVSALGHRHPVVMKAMKDQMDKYMHLMVYGELVQAPQTKLAALLVSNLPEPLDNVYLTNSGSEAVEGALKLAKRYTGKTEIVHFRNAYHGSTQGALSVAGNENLKNAFRPLLGDTRQLTFNNLEDLEQISERSACVIAETIQGEAGTIVPDVEYMQSLRKRCDESGTLLILDEIQAGMGRTGKLWAFEHYGIVPDVLTLAKGFGGGMPIGAFIASKKIMQSLTDQPVLGHITTFGGNAVCAAAAHATLQYIVDNKLWDNARQLHEVFKQNLIHSKIKSLKGKGLLLAIEFEDFKQNKKVIDRCVHNGLLTDWFLFADHSLRLAPPMIINESEANKACHVLIQSIEEALV